MREDRNGASQKKKGLSCPSLPWDPLKALGMWTWQMGAWVAGMNLYRWNLAESTRLLEPIG